MNLMKWFKRSGEPDASGESLRAKATRGGAWLGSGNAVEQVTRFLRNMLLTRLLMPNAFGAMAIVLSVSSLITSLSDVGLAPAVIQNPRGGEDDYLNTAWWLGMFRAILIYSLVFPAAPWVASFYGNPELCSLLRVTMFGLVLDAAVSPRAKLAQKEMKFARVAIIYNGGAMCGVALTLILSFLLHSVWALAIGYCSENAFRCMLSYILCPGFPYLKGNKQATLDLFEFSKGMFGLSFLNLIFSRTDIFVLGKLYSPEVLGLYSMAVALIQTPGNFLVNTVAQTLLPAFSHLQKDSDRTNRVLAEVTGWVAVAGFPAMAALWLCGPSLLTVAYGGRYVAGAGAFAFGVAVAFLNTLNALITTQFYGAGHPALHRRAVAASAIVMIIATYPACKLFGPIGGQIAALIAIIASYLLQIAREQGLTGLKITEYGKGFVPGSLISAGVLLVGVVVRHIGFANTPFANIASSAAICLATYLACIPLFRQMRASHSVVK